MRKREERGQEEKGRGRDERGFCSIFIVGKINVGPRKYILVTET